MANIYISKCKIIVLLILLVLLGIILGIYKWNNKVNTFINAYCFRDCQAFRKMANELCVKGDLASAEKIYTKAINARFYKIKKFKIKDTKNKEKLDKDEFQQSWILFELDSLFEDKYMNYQKYGAEDKLLQICIQHETFVKDAIKNLKKSQKSKDLYNDDLVNNPEWRYRYGLEFEKLNEFTKAFDQYSMGMQKITKTGVFEQEIQYIPQSVRDKEKKEKEIEMEKHQDDPLFNFIFQKTEAKDFYGNKYDSCVFKVAYFLGTGQGCEKDKEKAKKLWAWLANHSNYTAMYNLAIDCLEQENNEDISKMIFQLFFDSANGGCIQSMKMLAYCYNTGLGCQIDKEAGEHWERIYNDNKKDLK